jgi:hypothetical protein
MTENRITGAQKPKVSRVEVYWHTVTYRTVVLYVLLVVVIVLALSYLVMPERSISLVRRFTQALENSTAPPVTPSARQARFVNLDGKVQVKKVNSVQWANADYQLTLDKGDLIQTGSEGVARVSFADGTTYTVKPDTLVTVEENLVAEDQATRVGVHISSGAVDLATGSWPVAGSKAEVSFENAVASMRANSRAAVRSDPSTKENEITVASGGADLQRGGEHLQVGQWEKAQFTTGAGAITKTQVLAPPHLVEPVNLQPIIVVDPKHTKITFRWEAVETAKNYILRVSPTALFTQVVTEKRATGTSAEVTGLDAGEYFWSVRAINAKNATSEASDPFKFTLVAQDKAQEMKLEVDATEIHGTVVEIIGHTEPGAALIINGQQVADMAPDGRFRYFTQPMSSGSQIIVITGQNRRGGTAIKRVAVVVP